MCGFTGTPFLRSYSWPHGPASFPPASSLTFAAASSNDPVEEAISSQYFVKDFGAQLPLSML